MTTIPGTLKGGQLTPTVAGWCYEQRFGRYLGLASAMKHHAPKAAVELFPADTWAALAEMGVVNKLALVTYDGFAPFQIGFGSDEEGPLVQTVTRGLIDRAAA